VDRGSDGNLAAAIRYAVNAGKVPGCILDAGKANIVGPITSQNYARIVLYAVRTIALPDAAASAMRTRGWEEKFGDAYQFILNLDYELTDVEGTYFATWQDLGAWMRGQTGRDTFWQSVVDVKVNAPFRTLEFSAGGSISTGSSPSGPPDPTPQL
jgi:hypothetical protein